MGWQKVLGVLSVMTLVLSQAESCKLGGPRSSVEGCNAYLEDQPDTIWLECMDKEGEPVSRQDTGIPATRYPECHSLHPWPECKGD